MLVHNDPLLYIFFGDERTSFDRDLLLGNTPQERFFEHPQIARLQKTVHLKSLALSEQIHSAQGIMVTGPTDLREKGDFLITDKERIGLTVYTADCLPIVIYDTYNRALAVCHAGWRGSLLGVAIKALEALQKNYNTDLEHLRIFFGPSARVCCYEVSPDFRDQFKDIEYEDQLFVTCGEQLFFDLPLFNKLQLEEYGVQRNAFHCLYNVCTICDTSFCSTRRNKDSNGRQLTIAMLK